MVQASAGNKKTGRSLLESLERRFFDRATLTVPKPIMSQRR
jgi:hypothetical protein